MLTEEELDTASASYKYNDETRTECEIMPSPSVSMPGCQPITSMDNYT
jgi:hypothetical protein